MTVSQLITMLRDFPVDDEVVVQFIEDEDQQSDLRLGISRLETVGGGYDQGPGQVVLQLQPPHAGATTSAAV
jgi:hypothetical protein